MPAAIGQVGALARLPPPNSSAFSPRGKPDHARKSRIFNNLGYAVRAGPGGMVAICRAGRSWGDARERYGRLSSLWNEAGL